MKHYVLLFLAACLAAPAAMATQVVSPGTAPSAYAKPPAVYPTRGMTAQQVRAQFGTPERMLPPDPATAQGPLKPPIIRWIYPQYIVYFERNFVIHTVLTHPREAPVPETR